MTRHRRLDRTPPVSRLAVLVTVTAAAVLVAGCSLFGRSDPRFFTLETLPPSGPLAAAPAVPVGIDSLTLPPGLERREVVVMREGRRLEVRSEDLWAAPLEEIVLHTLSFDLAARLPEGSVVLPGQPRPPAVASLAVVVEEMTAGPRSSLVLDARWTFEGTSRRERIELPTGSLDSPDVVAATSRALAELADRIVAALAGAG